MSQESDQETDVETAVRLLDAWRGQSCEITRDDDDKDVWHFAFGEAGELLAIAPWRLIAGDTVRYSEDDDQRLGPTAPIDILAEVRQLLEGKRVSHVTIEAATSDVQITFEGNTILELRTSSGVYEPWEAYAGAKTHIVAVPGDGRLVIWT
jgi:hypothetical protein